jgi:hypothetical protein
MAATFLIATILRVEVVKLGKMCILEDDLTVNPCSECLECTKKRWELR